jgi:hypothetical protein
VGLSLSAVVRGWRRRRERPPSRWLRFGLPPVLVGILALLAWPPPDSYVALLGAIAASGWLGGVGSAVLALLLSLASLAMQAVPPGQDPTAISVAEVFTLVLFLGVALLIVLLSAGRW